MIKIISIFVMSLISSFAMSKDETSSVDFAFDLNNRIVLPFAYKDLVIDFPSGIETIALKEGRELLVRPKEGAKKTFILTFVLSNDDVFQLKVTHKVLKSPVVWRYEGATDEQGEQYVRLDDKNKWISKVMVDIHQYIYGADYITPGLSLGEKGSRWELVVRDQHEESQVVLIPLFSWKGMKKKVEVYRVAADIQLSIENQDFYRDGDIAIALESDVAGPKFSPYLIVMREDL